MLAKVHSFGLKGLDGYRIDIEVDIHAGMPTYNLVGLADSAIKESKERIRAAMKNSGFNYPVANFIINLAPADEKKEGSFYDLPITIAIMLASGQIQSLYAKQFIMLGELSLNGQLRELNGILPMLISAKQQGYNKAIIPALNAEEASFIDGMEVYALNNLREVVEFLVDGSNFLPIESQDWHKVKQTKMVDNDLKYIKGQYLAKRAMEIAVAGGHNIMMIGPPGAGKTMLARSVPTIMPDLTFEEALEIAKIHSVAGILDGFVYYRPFRSPHHTASTVSLTGGGSKSKPGEISLAHNGVLFMDEMPEYTRKTLETLRQPLEDGQITIARSAQTVTYPANFILIASMNPCPCGNYGSTLHECRCSASQIHKYLNKVSGPLLDRIDIHVELDNVEYKDLQGDELAEDSATVRQRVNSARELQKARMTKAGHHCNAQMTNAMIKKMCKLDEESTKLLQESFDKLGLSARAYNRILKVARTIADLEGSENIKSAHLAEALQYRTLDRKYKI